MGKGRLEAFSDGVLAIIITIMVLEMKTPHDAELSALRPLASVFLSSVLRFLYLAVWRDPVACRGRVFAAAACDPCPGGSRLDSGNGGRQ
jgi:hypothetical protein